MSAPPPESETHKCVLHGGWVAGMALLRGGSNYRPDGSMWYFPQPGCESSGGASGRFCVDASASQVRGDLGQFNALLMLSEGMDRSSGTVCACVFLYVFFFPLFFFFFWVEDDQRTRIYHTNLAASIIASILIS